MTVSLVQSMSANSIVGDGQGGNDAFGTSAAIAWPKQPTNGNLLVFILASDNSGAATALATPSGWTRVGSILTSPDYAGNVLAVYYKTAGASESLTVGLQSTDSWGGRAGAVLLEYSGTTGFDKSASVVTAGASLTLTTAPSLSVTPTLAGSLIIWAGCCFDHHNDGTQKLTGVAQSGSATNLEYAGARGERLSAGDGAGYEYSVSIWAGHQIGAAASSQSSAPTWTWTGGSTSKPFGGACQIAVVFKG